nr:MAG TPA: hypothetical protein [Caudoviricetes sp.]
MIFADIAILKKLARIGLTLEYLHDILILK